MLKDEVLGKLVEYLSSDDSTLRLNALWAVKNLLWKASSEVKRSVMEKVGWHNLVSWAKVICSICDNFF
jgi:armadillo repeat-containing protein 8